MRYLFVLVLLACRGPFGVGYTASPAGTLAPVTYEIVTPQVASPARRSYAMLTLTGELGGAGPDTVLRFTGDAGGVQDWYGIALGSGSWLHDLTIDTSALTGTVEQTHAVRVLGPAEGIRIERVTFRHPARGMPGGDCIQLVGYGPDRLVSNVLISEVTLAACDRSGVAIHSGIRHLRVTDSTFVDVGDQDIDGEGTGDIDDVMIDHVTAVAGARAQGDLAIQIDTSSQVTLDHVTLAGRGVQLYGCDHCAILDSTIDRTVPGSAMPALDITKTSTDVVVRDTTIARAGTAVAGQVVRITPHNGQPSHVHISSTAMIQQTNAAALTAMGVDDLVMDTVRVAGGSIDITGSPTVRADRTAIIGSVTAGVRISGSYAGFGSLTANDNTGMGGLRCETVAGIAGPVVLARNTWSASMPSSFMMRCSLDLPRNRQTS